RDERIVSMRIAFGQFAAAGIGRAPAHRDMRVLAHEQRFEAALLERARQFVDRDAVVGRKMKGANQHSPPIQRVMPVPPRAIDATLAISAPHSHYPLPPTPPQPKLGLPDFGQSKAPNRGEGSTSRSAAQFCIKFKGNVASLPRPPTSCPSLSFVQCARR